MVVRDDEGIKNDKNMSHLPKLCVICNKEFIARRNDAEVCSAACRQKNWRKKKEAKMNPKTDPLSDLIDVRKEQDAFCERSGFSTSELIKKFEQLETKNGELLEKIKELEVFYEKFKDMAQVQAVMYLSDMAVGENKPQISPETGLPANPSKNQKKGNDGAENELSELMDTVIDENTRTAAEQFKKANYKGVTPKSKPAELSPFLKSRQNLKNGIK